MAEAAQQEVFDLHFTGLCLFALWADGVLSSNERDYLTDLLWINLSDDDGLKYDFEFGARTHSGSSLYFWTIHKFRDHVFQPFLCLVKIHPAAHS